MEYVYASQLSGNFAGGLKTKVDNITKTNTPKLSLMLLLLSFVITIIFLIIATYSKDIYYIWYAAASYISIIIIIICLILFVLKCRNLITDLQQISNKS
jgi:uncharacterized membrane protein YagU involved in acid resistance